MLLVRQLAYHLALKLSTIQQQRSFKPIASLVRATHSPRAHYDALRLNIHF